MKKELDNGLTAVTDGEFRRAFWHLDFLAGLKGIRHVKAEAWSVHFEGRQPKAETVVIEDRLSFPADHPFLEAFDRLKKIAGDAAVKYGVPRAVAYQLAGQMIAGTGKMAVETGKHPAVLKDAVCSPGGTPIKGVASLEEHGLRNAAIQAIDAIMQAK